MRTRMLALCALVSAAPATAGAAELVLDDIDYIAVIAQTGSAIGANDYAIKTFKAVGP